MEVARVAAAVPREVPMEKPPVLAAGALMRKKDSKFSYITQFFQDTRDKCQTRDNLSSSVMQTFFS